MDTIHKASLAPAGNNPLEYVMSDETVDRYGDVVEADGWSLANFKKNPVALFGHNASFIVGHWKNVRVEAGKLLGQLELLPAGISERLDEIRAAVEAGVLRAVSVGFRALSYEPIAGSKSAGVRYTRSELMECSLVAVPANPNAVNVARSLNLSDDVKRMIFGEDAGAISGERRGAPGEHATKSPHRRNAPMNISDSITAAQDELVQLKDQLAEHMKGEPDDLVVDELATKIDQTAEKVARFKKAESAMAKTVEPANTGERRPFAQAAKKTEAKDLPLRAAVVKVLAHIEKRPPLDILKERYGEDDQIKTMLDIVSKAASAPATTTTTGWAAELVQTATLDFLEDLMPMSVYPALRDRGGRFTFGRNGIVSIPSRSVSTSIAGSFVAQGAPIPVRQAAFAATTLTPKKMAVITTFTREIAEHSTPAIEGVLRQAIQEDTSVAIDTVLLDATAASTTRPAGLRNGVSAQTATTGGGFAAVVGDMKLLVGALITSTTGNLRAPVWIMNPVQALSLSLTQNAGGDFPFAADIAAGRLQGYPIIQSPTVAAASVFLVDAADFFSATGDEPRFDVSDQATLHMEDTTPLALGTAGSPNTVAAPVRSLWQTDTIGLRMILDMNWAMRRTGAIAYVTNVTW